MKKISIQKTRENLTEIIDQVAVGGAKVKIVPYKRRKTEKKKQQALEEVYGIWKERKDI